LKISISPALRVKIVVPGPQFIPSDCGLVLLVSPRTAEELGLRAGEMRSVSQFLQTTPGTPGAALNGALMLTKEVGDV
jgi:hypothetical protein